MNTQTLTRPDTDTVAYTLVERGVFVVPQPQAEADEFVIEMPNGRLRCHALTDTDDTRPTGPIVYRGITLAQAWQKLKNYREGVKDAHGLLDFRPHLLTWPDCQPVTRPTVATRVRPRVARRRPCRQAVK